MALPILSLTLFRSSYDTGVEKTFDPYDTRIVTLFELSQVSAPLRSVLNEHPLDVQHPTNIRIPP